MAGNFRCRNIPSLGVQKHFIGYLNSQLRCRTLFAPVCPQDEVQNLILSIQTSDESSENIFLAKISCCTVYKKRKKGGKSQEDTSERVN